MRHLHTSILLMLIIIVPSLLQAITLYALTSNDPILSAILEDIKPYVQPADPAYKLLLEASRTGDVFEAYKALTLDSDGDGIPNLFEYIDGLNPYMTNSFGYPDKEYFVGKIVVDGLDIDWEINHLSTTPLKITYDNLTGEYSVKGIYAVQDDKHLYVALMFSHKTVYINSTASPWHVMIDMGGATIYPVLTNQWGLCIETVFPKQEILSHGFTGTIQVTYMPQGHNYVVRAYFNITRIGWLGPRSWDGFVEPIYLRLRTNPSDLPWYPVIAMGDTQQDWFKITYTSHTYSSLWQARTIAPDALIIAGDETGSGMKKQVMEFLRASAGIANIWPVAGNHDWSYTKYNDRPYWYRMMVNDLYVRDLGEWSFVLLNGFALDKALAEELDETLHKVSLENKYIVLVWHVPIITGSYNYPTDFSKWQMDTLRSLVAKYKSHIKLMIFGHWHLWRTGVYDGIRYIITGGAGAPWLSSPKLGLPIYHYTVLVFYNNGTFTYTPVSTDNGRITVNWTRTGNAITYIIHNTKVNVYGKLVTIPVHIVRYIRGVCIEAYVMARPGTTKLTINIDNNKLSITSNSKNWYVYSWINGLHYPSDGRVIVKLIGPSTMSIGSIYARNKDVIAYTYPAKTTEAWIKLTINNTFYTAMMSSIDNNHKSYSVMNILGMNSKAYINDTVSVYITNGIITLSKTATGLDFMPPIIKIMYFTEYVKDWENITIVEYDASTSTLLVLLDGVKTIYNGSLSPGTNKISLTIPLKNLVEGHHYLLIKAWDKYNNTVTEKLCFIIDRTPPRILVENPYQVTSPQQYIYIHSYDNDTYTVTVSCPLTGMSQYYSGLHGDAEIKLQPIALGLVSNGTYKLVITAADLAGNTANKTITLIIGAEKTITTTVTTHTSTTTTTTSPPHTIPPTTSTPTTSTTIQPTSTGKTTNNDIALLLGVLVAAVVSMITIYFLVERRK